MGDAGSTIAEASWKPKVEEDPFVAWLGKHLPPWLGAGHSADPLLIAPNRPTFLNESYVLLYRAVLLDAVRILARRSVSSRLYKEAWRWVCRECDDPFGFDSVCWACSLEPEYLRSGLRKMWSKRNVDRPRHVPVVTEYRPVSWSVVISV